MGSYHIHFRYTSLNKRQESEETLELIAIMYSDFNITLTFLVLSTLCTSVCLGNVIKSNRFLYTRTVNVSEGAEYDDKLYRNVMHCGNDCLNTDCDNYTVSEAEDGRRFHCLFDVAEEDLPKGNWDIYRSPGNI